MSSTSKNKVSNVSSDKGVTNSPNPNKSEKEKEKDKAAGGKGVPTKVESKGEAEVLVGSGTGEDKGEEITGLGTGDPSPVTPGRSRPLTSRIRPRMSSVGSADLRVANTDLWRREEKKVGICMSEIEEYVSANFSKEKHGSYLGARFKKIKDSMEYLEQEFKKVARLAGRVASLEERLAGAARKIDDLQEHIMDGVGAVVKSAVEEAMGRAVEKLIRKGSEDRELWFSVPLAREKGEAYERLFDKFKEIDVNASSETEVKKVNYLGSVYRKELAKSYTSTYLKVTLSRSSGEIVSRKFEYLIIEDSMALKINKSQYKLNEARQLVELLYAPAPPIEGPAAVDWACTRVIAVSGLLRHLDAQGAEVFATQLTSRKKREDPEWVEESDAGGVGRGRGDRGW
ncbi:hypothetical protein GE061_000196 [Apolygus lucorum]|uniref:Uncharacterized protein n=1 Tax=Apolygus lucorum TaxID=248454 RepID=A0A8S9Y5K4_APOLU|nr:hypothetical protein GE061_000196 [Apolygus lucorum]